MFHGLLVQDSFGFLHYFGLLCLNLLYCEKISLFALFTSRMSVLVSYDFFRFLSMHNASFCFFFSQKN